MDIYQIMGDSGGRAYTLKVASSAFLHIFGLFGSDVVENQCIIIITYSSSQSDW